MTRRLHIAATQPEPTTEQKALALPNFGEIEGFEKYLRERGLLTDSVAAAIKKRRDELAQERKYRTYERTKNGQLTDRIPD